MTEEKRKELITYLDSFLSRNDNYHNHKETMVNVALLLQLGLFGAVINKEWSSIPIPVWQVTIVYIFFWGLVHIYMKWQLSNKIRASIYQNGLDKSLRQLIGNNSINEDNEGEALPLKVNKRSKLVFYIQLLFKDSPVISYDYSISGLPVFIVNNIQEAIRVGTHASFHEKLMNRSSFIILGFSLIRILCYH